MSSNMPEDSSPVDLSDADIFSRGGLKYTFELVRRKNPELALRIRNITGGAPLPKTNSQPTNKNSDHFRVDLDSFQVRAIVEALIETTQQNPEGGKPAAMGGVARTLMEDWMTLAQKMIAELPDREKPL